MPGIASILFDADIPVFNCHRGAYMYLYSDPSFHGTIGFIIIDHYAHHTAIDHMCQ